MFENIRTAVITRSILVVMCFLALGGATSAQDPTPSPTGTPTASPTPGPVVTITPSVTVIPLPSPTTTVTVTTPTPIVLVPEYVVTVQPTPAAPAKPQPPESVYKNIKLGATRDELRSLLGKPVIDDPDGMFYQFDNEMVQIRFDKDKKLRLIAVTYTAALDAAPAYADLFGTQPVPNAAGGIYHLERYPEAGYWVSYSKAAIDSPTLTVTMQKID